MGEMTFSQANTIVETLDEKLSGVVLKKQFKMILDRLERHCQPDERLPKSAKADKVKIIVDYLNKKAGTKYRVTTRQTQTLIVARFKDGYEIADFKHVIDVKCAEWLGTAFQKHLRPKTLFKASKFENYVNQKPVKSQSFAGKVTPEWSKEDYKNETSTEELAQFERNHKERLKRLGKPSMV
jgi:uncharacterized phage protein (TIGR02220 family)